MSGVQNEWEKKGECPAVMKSPVQYILMVLASLLVSCLSDKAPLFAPLSIIRSNSTAAVSTIFLQNGLFMSSIEANKIKSGIIYTCFRGHSTGLFGAKNFGNGLGTCLSSHRAFAFPDWEMGEECCNLTFLLNVWPICVYSAYHGNDSEANCNTNTAHINEDQNLRQSYRCLAF